MSQTASRVCNNSVVIIPQLCQASSLSNVNLPVIQSQRSLIGTVHDA